MPVRPGPFSKQSATVVAAVAIAAIGLGVWHGPRGQSVAEEDAVSIPPPKITTVTALGWLEPSGETVAVAAPPSLSGNRIAAIAVSEGDRVETGETIATLDNHDRLAAALERARDNVRISEARLAQVSAGAKAGDIQAQSARAAQNRDELQGQISSQRAAIATLEAQLSGEHTTRLATIERLEAELRNAETDCQRYEMLYEGGAVSTQRRDSECLRAATAYEQVVESRADLERIHASRSAQIAEASATLDHTILTLGDQIAAADATLAAIAEVRPEDLELAKAELAASHSALREAEVNYNDAFVRAPQNGQILEVHVRPGESARDSAIVDLGETKTMMAVAEVYDSDVGKVTFGQTATITAATFEEPLTGTVEEIGLQVLSQSEVDIDPSANLDARIVEVRIRLDERSSRIAARATNQKVTVSIDI